MRRSRSAVTVTSSQRDSDEEDQHDQEDIGDSEDDWKPAKKKGAAAAKGKRKSTASAATPKGRAKRYKQVESEEESEEEEDDEEEDIESEESDEEGGRGENNSGAANKARMSIADKDGNIEFHLFKNDLTKDFRNDEKLCLWRRDGASMLQKYMIVSDESQSGDIIFNASSVYSCWEEKRKTDFFPIKVHQIGDQKKGTVKVVDIAEFEKYASEDRPKVDITPKGAEGGENYEEGSEEECDMNEEDEDEE